MVLYERLESLNKTTKKTGICAFQALYESLSKVDQKAIDAAFEIKMPTSLIVKALRQEGHKTSNDSLRAHLKGQCKCPRQKEN